QSLPILGAAAVAGGVVFVGCIDKSLHAYDASTGAELWSAQRSEMFGGVSISTTSVITGSADRNVYAFALPFAPPPPPPAAAAAVSVNSPTAGDQWTKGETYDVVWSLNGPVSRGDVRISRYGGTLLAAVSTCDACRS